MIGVVEYTKEEERLNIITHLIGAFLAIIGTSLLIIKSTGSTDKLVSSLIYGGSMILLYSASSGYHLSSFPLRKKLQIIDHASIFILIAGTYTPFAVLTLPKPMGWYIFSITWFFALLGVILKLFFTGRYNKTSTILYTLLGWNIIFVISTLIENLGWMGFYWLLAGGISYSVGAFFFMFENMKFNHAIFHVFVLLGSFLQFISIYYFVL